MRESNAERAWQPVTAANDRDPKDVVEAHKLLGLVDYLVTNSPRIDLRAARHGLSSIEMERAWSAHGHALDWLRKVEAALRGEP